ncbi:hypothetical protein [Glycomyces sp. YM15]|uniref:hypothetical protein n=1 Tax=Glycomyces sp. YM15 TaxID=2800446 RepID=UPI0019656E6E|nr:hypothetical protein [Glycomyces sp. YM15]
MSYTRDQVSTAVNAGADTIKDALELGERDADLINLIVNAALTCLDRPDASFDDVVNENYGETTPEDVRGWWDW